MQTRYLCVIFSPLDCLSRLRISEASYRPAGGPGASMGWSTRWASVVNDRVPSYVGSATVSPCVRLFSCLAGWSGASDTRRKIQNDIFMILYLLPGSPSYNFIIDIIIIIIIIITCGFVYFFHCF